MTRPSSAGSIWTRRRRCRAMRSITSSIGSNTLGLFQHRLELLPRPLHAHLQRGDTRAGESGHVLVLELLDMLEEERLTRVGRETRQRPSDRVVPLGPPVRSRQRRGLECRRIDRKSTRLNSSHQIISYAVFCLKKKKNESDPSRG